MGRWAFGRVYELMTGLGLMEWMVLKIVKAGE